MENLTEILIFIGIIALFAGIGGFMLFSKMKRKNASWTGVIIDKKVTETSSSPRHSRHINSRPTISFGTERNAINRHYKLIIRADSGNEFSWPVGEGFYETIQVGERLTKNPGTETPTKVSPQ